MTAVLAMSALPSTTTTSRSTRPSILASPNTTIASPTSAPVLSDVVLTERGTPDPSGPDRSALRSERQRRQAQAIARCGEQPSTSASTEICFMSAPPFGKPHGSAPCRTRRTPGTSARPDQTHRPGAARSRRATAMRAAFTVASARCAKGDRSCAQETSRRLRRRRSARRWISSALPTTISDERGRRRNLRGRRAM